MTHSGQRKEVVPCDTLYLSNVPASSCVVHILFKHFKKYGHIRSIWTNGTNAVITFSTKEEAIKAYKSPEAYANNRFVHYHYHLAPEKAESRLSLAVDTDYVNKTLKEVADQIAAEQRKTIELQSQMAKTHKSSYDDIQDQKKKMELHYKALSESYEKADTPEKQAEIKQKMDEITNVINEINQI
ncbi:hypothetical protein TRFO_05724 [Tritrichomonas foetus]|uniref:RRM domain-containing protein n=1 Tax=Tritrichomonas foetus TaxID=1144522 RepID=A0A1J4K512_9EUKA|nr:hypothetical protein TRFO_05724 [Tritrichomonas foetus]|eukprot:OHT06066.1 hypothetical protein TRFO_05724 [Tritrichomonas foetus]